MRKNFSRPLIFSLLISLIVAVFPCGESFSGSSLQLEPHTKYTLYIGLSYGDEGRQIFTFDEAKTAFNEAASKYVDGYTVYEANGFWREDGQSFFENTLVCVIVDASDEAIENVMNDSLKVFHQNSILIEKEIVRSAFYECH